MAKQKGVNAVTVWLIVFVGLWLVSTVFLVVLYTGQEEIRKDNASLKKGLGECVNAGERQSIELVKQAGTGDRTMVGILEEARGETASAATGSAKDDVSVVKQKRDDALSTIKRDAFVSKPEAFAGLSLYDALNKLYDEFRREHTLRTEGDKQIASLTGQVQNLIATNEKERADFEKRAGDLSDSMKSVEADRTKYRQDRDKQVAGLEAGFKQRNEQTDAALTDERNKRATSDKQLTDMKRRFASQQEKFSELMIGPGELSTARRADGIILLAVPGDDVVYINLGDKDRLVLGMQFAVYPADGTIPVDGRSKAQIEVVAVSTESSECRVVRVTPNQVILEGDAIANPVYDPLRPLSFVVVGEFDLNHDGLPDGAGPESVEAMIRGWGGQVTNELTALTDFVVLGRAPRRPLAAAEGAAAAGGDTNEMTRRAWNRYEDSRTTANALSIPILTQEVFLNFLGYADRVASR